MKRALCLLLALVFVLSLGAQVFADDILFCRKCGRQIPVDSNVCPYCGVSVVYLDGSVAAPVQAAAQTAGKSPSPATAAATDPGPFKSLVRSSGNLRVTKSPTSESVPYGGACIFIAHADNASSVVWYIANADRTVICEAAEAASVNNGLYVSGSRAETLALSGIPSWMNGYQVQACFSSSEGKVYTDVAKIWTYAQKEKCKWDYPEWMYLYPWIFECWGPTPWLNPGFPGPNPWDIPGPRPDPGPGPGPGPDPGPDPGPGPGPGPGPIPWDDPNYPDPWYTWGDHGFPGPDPWDHPVNPNPPTPPENPNPPTPPENPNPPTPPENPNPPAPPENPNPPAPPENPNPPTPPENPGPRPGGYDVKSALDEKIRQLQEEME